MDRVEKASLNFIEINLYDKSNYYDVSIDQFDECIVFEFSW